VVVEGRLAGAPVEVALVVVVVEASLKLSTLLISDNTHEISSDHSRLLKLTTKIP
jgi:hypothetical protein